MNSGRQIIWVSMLVLGLGPLASFFAHGQVGGGNTIDPRQSDILSRLAADISAEALRAQGRAQEAVAQVNAGNGGMMRSYACYLSSSQVIGPDVRRDEARIATDLAAQVAAGAQAQRAAVAAPPPVAVAAPAGAAAPAASPATPIAVTAAPPPAAAVPAAPVAATGPASWLGNIRLIQPDPRLAPMVPAGESAPSEPAAGPAPAAPTVASPSPAPMAPAQVAPIAALTPLESPQITLPAGLPSAEPPPPRAPGVFSLPRTFRLIQPDPSLAPRSVAVAPGPIPPPLAAQPAPPRVPRPESPPLVPMAPPRAPAPASPEPRSVASLPRPANLRETRSLLGEPLVAVDECNEQSSVRLIQRVGAVSSPITRGNVRCDRQREISAEFYRFLERNFNSCVSEALSVAYNIQSQVVQSTFSHVSVTRPGARVRGTGQLSNHAAGRAIDITSIQYTLADGQTNEINYPYTRRGTPDRLFFDQLRTCWDQANVERGCRTYGGGVYRCSIGWEESNHRDHLHLALPYCPDRRGMSQI